MDYCGGGASVLHSGTCIGKVRPVRGGRGGIRYFFDHALNTTGRVEIDASSGIRVRFDGGYG